MDWPVTLSRLFLSDVSIFFRYWRTSSMRSTPSVSSTSEAVCKPLYTQAAPTLEKLALLEMCAVAHESRLLNTASIIAILPGARPRRKRKSYSRFCIRDTDFEAQWLQAAYTKFSRRPSCGRMATTKGQRPLRCSTLRCYILSHSTNCGNIESSWPTVAVGGSVRRKHRKIHLVLSLADPFTCLRTRHRMEGVLLPAQVNGLPP